MWTNKNPVGFQQWKNLFWNNSFPDIRKVQFQSYRTYLSFGTPWPLRISHIYDTARKTLYPTLNTTSCVALFLNNFADLEWINVRCAEPLSTTILCQRHISLYHDRTGEPPFISHTQHCIKIQQFCCIFVWKNRIETRHFFFLTQIEELEFLFKGTRENFPPMLLPREGMVVTYYRYSDVFHFRNENTSCGGLSLLRDKPSLFVIGGNILTCNDSSFISPRFLYHEQFSCKSSSHTECQCSGEDPTASSNVSPHLSSNFHKQNCSGFHFNLLHQFQKNGIIMKEQSCEETIFTCFDNQLISSCLLNDFVVDCDHGAEDETFLELIAKGRKQGCEVKGTIQCRKGHPRCFNVSLVCKYQFNTAQVLFPCRTGEHLENCREFVCNMMFKCPGSFCVPWGYVCNGRWDCPGGTDEDDKISCVMPRLCKHMFKCGNSSLCVHLSDVCDSKHDCPFFDDEQYCTLHSVQCPKVCYCIQFSMKCSGISYFPDGDRTIMPYQVINIHNCTIHFSQSVIQSMGRIFSLDIQESDLVSLNLLCPKRHCLEFTAEINVAHNRISELASECLRYLTNMRQFVLKSNKLTALHKKTFNGLLKLIVLDLSQNPLKNLCFGQLLALPKLLLLNLENVFMPLTIEAACMTNEKELTYLLADDPHLCCLVSRSAVCSANQVWFLKCGSLLLNKGLKGTFYIESSLIFLLNSVSLLVWLKSIKSKKNVFTEIVVSLNTTDIAFALNLCVLWVFDLYFGNNFGLEEETWRKSYVCFTVLFAFVLCCISSPFIQALLTFQRLCAVLFPLKTYVKQKILAGKVVVFIPTAFLPLSLMITLLVKHFEGTVLSVLCYPFVSTVKDSSAILGLTVCVFCVHIATILFMAVSYMEVYLKIKQSQMFVGKHISPNNLRLVLQLVTLLSVKILSWIPSGLIFLVLHSKDEYPLTIPAWTIICVTTLNPLITPVIFHKFN